MPTINSPLIVGWNPPPKGNVLWTHPNYFPLCRLSTADPMQQAYGILPDVRVGAGDYTTNPLKYHAMLSAQWQVLAGRTATWRETTPRTGEMYGGAVYPAGLLQGGSWGTPKLTHHDDDLVSFEAGHPSAGTRAPKSLYTRAGIAACRPAALSWVQQYRDALMREGGAAPEYWLIDMETEPAPELFLNLSGGNQIGCWNAHLQDARYATETVTHRWDGKGWQPWTLKRVVEHEQARGMRWDLTKAWNHANNASWCAWFLGFRYEVLDHALYHALYSVAQIYFPLARFGNYACSMGDDPSWRLYPGKNPQEFGAFGGWLQRSLRAHCSMPALYAPAQADVCYAGEPHREGWWRWATNYMQGVRMSSRKSELVPVISHPGYTSNGYTCTAGDTAELMRRATNAGARTMLIWGDPPNGSWETSTMTMLLERHLAYAKTRR